MLFVCFACCLYCVGVCVWVVFYFGMCCDFNSCCFDVLLDASVVELRVVFQNRVMCWSCVRFVLLTFGFCLCLDVLNVVLCIGIVFCVCVLDCVGGAWLFECVWWMGLLLK